MLAPRRLLWLALAAATLCTAAAVVHDEAPIVSVNGTFNTHFLAHITDLQPGACVIFEAQARAPQEEGELCISGAGVKATGITVQGGHPLDAGRLLPHNCSAKGLRIAEIITDDPKDCFLHKAQQLDNPGNIVEECDAKSPYSYQFIDPTRHTPTYGVPSTHPLAKLCAKLLAGLPESGATLQEGDAVTLRRGHAKHKGLEGKCLKSATYVVVNPCEGPIASMLFQGTSEQCQAGMVLQATGFPPCSAAQGGANAESEPARIASGVFVASLIVVAAATAVALLVRKRRAAQRRTVEECAELTSGMPTSSSDPERQ